MEDGELAVEKRDKTKWLVLNKKEPPFPLPISTTPNHPHTDTPRVNHTQLHVKYTPLVQIHFLYSHHFFILFYFIVHSLLLDHLDGISQPTVVQ